jgi:hypothetical protein
LNSYDDGENFTFWHDRFVCSVVAALLAVSCPAFWALRDRQAGAQPNRQLQQTARTIAPD